MAQNKMKTAKLQGLEGWRRGSIGLGEINVFQGKMAKALRWQENPKLKESIQRIFKDLICVHHYVRYLVNIHLVSNKVPDLTSDFTFRMANSKDLNAAKTSFRITMQPSFQESDCPPETFFNNNFVFNAFENYFPLKISYWKLMCVWRVWAWFHLKSLY